MDRKELFKEYTDIVDSAGELKYVPLNQKVPCLKFIKGENHGSRNS